jgi:DEAD/DEAH box helicase domain-containing protein
MSKIICWDLEIETPVHDNPLGWEAARSGGCGISCLVASDSDSGRFHLYDKHDLDEAVDHLNSADLLVGFNTIDFDSSVIFGVTGRYITVPQYDILKEIYSAIGKRVKGFKLEEVGQHTLAIGKSGNGEFATTLVKRQHFGKLFDYCLNDVHLVKVLYNHIMDFGWIRGANDEEVHLEKPLIEEYA